MARNSNSNDGKTKKSANVKITTPICPTGWNSLNKYDDFKGAKNYKTTLLMTPEELDTIKEKIDAEVDKAFDDAVEELETELEETKSAKKKKELQKTLDALEKNYPYEEEEDDDGEPTGRFAVKFKSKPKKNRAGKLVPRFPLVDAKGKPTKVFVSAGSRIRVEAFVVPYFMAATNIAGVTLYLKAVQVAELAGEGGGGHGFGAIDGGFEDDGSYEGDDDDDGDDTESDDDDDDDGDDDF